jgi:hypothetical protein
MKKAPTQARPNPYEGMTLKEIAEAIKDIDLFPEKVERAKQTIAKYGIPEAFKSKQS